MFAHTEISRHSPGGYCGELSKQQENSDMGFLDSVSGGGQKRAGFDGKAGNHVVRGSDEVLNNQEMVADIYGARGGYARPCR
jgi:hypothetical protein